MLDVAANRGIEVDTFALSKELGFQLVSNQPQYSALWRVIEGKVVPTSEELGISQIVWSPMAQGVLSGKYLPGQPVPDGSRATDEKSGANFIKRFLCDEVLEAVQKLKPIADEAAWFTGAGRGEDNHPPGALGLR